MCNTILVSESWTQVIGICDPAYCHLATVAPYSKYILDYNSLRLTYEGTPKADAIVYASI